MTNKVLSESIQSGEKYTHFSLNFSNYPYRKINKDFDWFPRNVLKFSPPPNRPHACRGRVLSHIPLPYAIVVGRSISNSKDNKHFRGKVKSVRRGVDILYVL